MTTRILTNSASIARVSDRLKAGLACLFIGVSMVFTVGLSQIDAVHNAAHDTRHAIGFPCH
ncbi:MAG: CbtB-domain containing protein [Alphaproteobacteria bacterium]|nr:CbtB-domain containing protein [Alphaproteobacteria bacterium]